MVALVCLGGIISAWAYSSARHTQDVVAVRTSVPRGEVIEAGDLMRVQVGVDPALHVVAASRLGDLVGQRAAFDLPVGSLVTDEEVSDALVPAAGQSLVGVSLSPAMMPAEPLVAGDDVRVVSTPGDQGEVAAEPVIFTATVTAVRSSAATGATVVDVTVPADRAAELAAWAATGRVALVLDSRER